MVAEVSNGGTHGAESFTIPARGAVTLSTSARDFAPSPIWMTRLDAPPAVVIEGRLEYRFETCSLVPQPDFALSKMASPVFRALTPPGIETFHPGTDLGVQNVRINVGVYNDGEVAASAVIQVYRPGCPARGQAVKVISVPAKSLVQESVFETPPACLGLTDVREWITATTVTVDQPSLSFTSILSNTERPNATFAFGSQPR